MNAKPRPMVHELKCDAEAFAAVKRGRKPMELRKDDRDIQAGDYVLLREWVDGAYTGDTVMSFVLNTIRHGERYGEMLAAGCMVMGVLPFRRPRSI